LRDTFRKLAAADDIKAVVFGSNEGNFCSGGDVRDIIGPLLDRDMKGLLEFTRMTGDLVKAMRACPQPIVAAVDGVCVGAGAMIALFCDMRLGTPQAKTAFLFTRVGLAGCDMGACAMLPRVIGQGRASELLFTGRTMNAEEGAQWGFFNRLVASDKLQEEALALAQKIAQGPTFAHMMDQNNARPGMVHVPRAGDRSGGAGASDLHADRRFPTCLRGFHRKRQVHALPETDR
jgi:enoyl-CoA hydratase/carnithine racemase